MSDRGASLLAAARRGLETWGPGALFVALAAWSWLKWTDPLIDFGLELYLPWRITEGEVLYRDLAYRNGPLSPYWNAVWFALAGVSIRTLIVVNLVVLAVITALLQRAVLRGFGRLAASAATACFLAIFAFSQYGTVGNYNFVTPYQHGQSHGLVLGLAALLLLGSALRLRDSRLWMASGLCLGLAALTKAEVFLPMAATAAAALTFATARGEAIGRTALPLGLCAALPVLCAGAALATQMPFETAVRGIAGNWLYVGSALGEAFYRTQAGLDAPLDSALRMAASSAVLAAFVIAVRGVAAPLARVARSPGTRIAVAALLCAALVLPGWRLPWFELGAALLPASALAVQRFGARAWRERWQDIDGPELARAVPAALLAVYALVMLAKLGLRPQIQHYGFALAAPAFALGVAGLLEYGPRPGADPNARACARALIAGTLAAFALAQLQTSQRVYTDKTLPLGHGRDRIQVASPETSPRGQALRKLLVGLDVLIPADGTLLVMPEGVSINYWLRRVNPTPYSLFLPTEIAAHGGDGAMLARIEDAPPDFVVLVHRGSREFGTGPFLRDLHNGRGLGEWLQRDYARIQRIGSEPFTSAHFGIDILRRREPNRSRRRRPEP